MKKTTFFLLLTATLTACTSSVSNNTYFIHGNYKDTDSHTIYLICSNQVIDSTTVKENGEFTFNGTADIPQLAYVADARSIRNAINSCTIILEPGLLSVFPLENSADYYVTGSKSNNLYAEFTRKAQELTNYYESHEGEEGVLEEVETKYNKILSDGVTKNPDNLFGLVCLKELAYEQDPALTRKMLDAFKPSIRQSDLWKQLDERNQKMLATSAGHQYMEFSQTDQFDPPPVWPKDKVFANCWHLRAATKPTYETTFLTVLQPRKNSDFTPRPSVKLLESDTAQGVEAIYNDGSKAIVLFARQGVKGNATLGNISFNGSVHAVLLDKQGKIMASYTE